jgi:RNA polymerase sigma-70 factor (ECF subfamily)
VTVPVTPDITDLARRARVGETAAADELVRELEPLVVRTVRLIVGSGSWAAEDAAQDALLDISRGVHSLRDPQAVTAWAVRVATQRAIKVSRRERLRLLRRSPDLDPALLAESNEPAVGRDAAIKAAFDRLPPRLRATAVLRLYVGLGEAETADALGCSVGAVKSNLHDARDRLARALYESGFEPAVMPKEAT